MPRILVIFHPFSVLYPDFEIAVVIIHTKGGRGPGVHKKTLFSGEKNVTQHNQETKQYHFNNEMLLKHHVLLGLSFQENPTLDKKKARKQTRF